MKPFRVSTQDHKAPARSPIVVQRHGGQNKLVQSLYYNRPSSMNQLFCFRQSRARHAFVPRTRTK